MRKLLMTTALIATGIVIIGGNTSKAVLQSNSTTHMKPTAKVGGAWMQEVRKMEISGQTMGLSETLSTDLSPKTSNNIDVHMMKSTEYGAMAILSASGFGNSKKLSEVDIKTTTGNVTGVYLTGDRWEIIAGGGTNIEPGQNKRYFDLYGEVKIGDTLGKTTDSNSGCILVDGDNDYTGGTWHGGVNHGWLVYTWSCFLRGKNGIFAMNGDGDWTDSHYYSRGVAVIGEGL